MLAWLTRITGSPARNDARLLLVVLAIVAGTVVSSLALLVSVTEQGGLRSASPRYPRPGRSSG